MATDRVDTHPSAHATPRLEELEQRVVEHCHRHGVLRPGESVLALVSGGPDSVCALDLLTRVHDGPLGALVVDHGLREDSDIEAERAAAVAESRGVHTYVERVDVAGGASLQDAARGARWGAARRVAAREGASVLATGHTADDQAETVLFRIARGTGRSGALGMAPRDGDIARPVLCLTADETDAWCRERGLSTVEDPSNADPRFARVRVRNDALPALERVHPGASSHLADLAELLRDEAEILEPVIEAAWSRCAREEGLATDALAAEHPAIQRLLLRRLLENAGAPGEARARRGVERARVVLMSGSAATLPGAVDVTARDGVLVARPRPAAPPVAVAPR
jgi:tRNA(Ile)-lysidine synthase